ncbi:hypothetical protein [Amnibacterium endophyticum]|uniref:DUF2530 domain-containing protein n=1 Tax=Amnibacterium endophyticum TaxID=2109337 RepID=A0ABW4LFX8_9MICO
MDGRRRRAWQEGFDYAIGFFGFFAVAFCVLCLVFQVIGRDALWWAWATVLCAVLAGGIWLIRRGVLRSLERAEAERAEGV